jgi:hypothetical protein
MQRQAWALTTLAEVLHRTGDVDEAERVARSITSASQSSALMALAKAVAQAGDLDRAERIARSITNPGCRADTLAEVAEGAALADDCDRAVALLREAEETTRSITDNFQQMRALANVAGGLARASDLDGAERIARSITIPGYRADVLNVISHRIEPEQRPRFVARNLQSGPWYESASDLLSMATDAFNEALNELCADPIRE